MSVQLFDVVLRCDARGLARVLEQTQGGLGVSFVNLHPVRDDQPQIENKVFVPKPRKVMAYANGKRDKGISGRDLALQTLRSENRIFNASEISDVFAKRGFAGNSVWAVLSLLIREGLVRKLGEGKYAASGTTINFGASSAKEQLAV